MSNILISEDQNTVTINTISYTFVVSRNYGDCSKCDFKKIDCSKIPCIEYSISGVNRKDGRIGYFKLKTK